MKKLIIGISVILLMLSLAACGDKSPSESVENNGGAEGVSKEIIYMKENPENSNLEVIYVSENNIDTLCDFYEGALKDADNLNTTEMTGGYIIAAEADGISYHIMLSEEAMDPSPEYAGKKSVYINLSGL
ncbi:hypothetical protein MASR2M70_16870 [Bacillota bacterium]